MEFLQLIVGIQDCTHIFLKEKVSWQKNDLMSVENKEWILRNNKKEMHLEMWIGMLLINYAYVRDYILKRICSS